MLQNAVVDMLVKCALISKEIRDSVSSKATPTPSHLHKDTAVGTKNLKFGLIRSEDRFPPV